MRTLQENLFTNALDSSEGVEHDAWRAELSEDYRDPETELSVRQAIGHRVRRVYLPLMGAMLAGWLFHVWAFNPDKGFIESAALPGLPGWLVVATVTVYYALLVVLAVPYTKKERGEASEADHGNISAD